MNYKGTKFEDLKKRLLNAELKDKSLSNLYSKTFPQNNSSKRIYLKYLENNAGEIKEIKETLKEK